MGRDVGTWTLGSLCIAGALCALVGLARAAPLARRTLLRVEAIRAAHRIDVAGLLVNLDRLRGTLAGLASLAARAGRSVALASSSLRRLGIPQSLRATVRLVGLLLG